MFDANLLDRLRGVGDPSPVPIFIVGMPRSGSTLVEQILASHPQVHAAGELKNLNQRGPTRRRFRRPSRSLSGRVGHLAPTACGDWARIIWPACRAPDGKTRITDKAPSNFFQVGLIRLILPNARIIHTLRDPVEPAFRVSRAFCARSRSVTIWASWDAITADITS